MAERVNNCDPAQKMEVEGRYRTVPRGLIFIARDFATHVLKIIKEYPKSHQ